MTTQQLLISGLIVLMLGAFIWNKWRFDLVALSTLLLTVILGLVPANEAFRGLSSSAVITVAAVLVMSNAMAESGLVDEIMRLLQKVGEGIRGHLLVLTGGTALLSSVMNNVGALAIFMPVAVRLAQKGKYSPSKTLMLLAYASVFGGMITLIGSPPNIIISDMFAQHVGQPLGMFSYTPLGLIISVVLVITTMLLGPYLTPDKAQQSTVEDTFRVSEFTAKLSLPEGSALAGKTPAQSSTLFAGVMLIAVERGNTILRPTSRLVLEAGDEIIVEANKDQLGEFMQRTGTTTGEDFHISSAQLRELGQELHELVVSTNSPIAGRTVRQLRLFTRFNLMLLGISREGIRLTQPPEETRLRTGDILLMMGSQEKIDLAMDDLDLLALNEGDEEAKPRDLKRLLLSLGIFVTAVLLTTFKLLPVDVAFVLGAVAMVFAKVVDLPTAYKSIQWPLLILIGALIPVSNALDSTGMVDLIASWLTSVTASMPIWAALAVLMGITILLSNIVNNAASALLLGPIGAGLAQGLGADPAPFLMAVFVGACTSYMTPIAHPSNTLVMGPGGYTFKDYLLPGAVLSIVTMIVAVPAIMILWM